METINDALIQAVKDLGGSKIVGPMLWPELLIDQAQKKLLDCLNPERQHHLTPEQASLILRKAKEAGKHEAMEFVCAYIGYSNPTPIEPADERAQLQKQFIAAKDVIVSLMGRMEKLG